MNNRQKSISFPVLFSLFGFVFMMAFYFGVVSLFESFEYAIQKFKTSGVLIILLSLGFAYQIFLHAYMNQVIKRKSNKVITATSGMASGTAMILCCLHHVTDLIPIAGISLFGILSPSFESVWMIVGLSINVIAILFLFSHMKKHQAYSENSYFRLVNHIPIRFCVIAVTIVSIIVIYIQI
ncbi:MAG: hypothetical protein K8R73_00050 [Clostridiales bacterium]|nr:hypothetical protein [Clostridiales bacterium]